MQNKIDIPGTSITLEIVDKNITITNKIEYDMQMHFKNTDADASLDTSGDVFEPLYWLDIRVTSKTTSGIFLTFVVSRENYNEISDIIVRHFNYCDRMGRISRL